MSYILLWGSLLMSKRDGQLFDNWDGSTAFWQYRHNPAGSEKQQPHKQSNQNTDDTWIIFLGILFTIGFIALLAITTLGNLL
jgi:hypothetical protein